MKDTGRTAPDSVDRAVGWVRAHPVVPDTVLAAVVALLSLTPTREPLDVAVAIGTSAALILRRVRPVTSGSLVAVAGVAAILAGVAPGPIMLAALVSGYSLAAHGPRWSGISAAVLMVAGMGLLVVVSGMTTGPDTDSLVTALLVAATVLALTVWLGGTLRRASRRNLEHLRERARLLEAEQETQARLARLAERARIAREMHDIVAHSLSVIVVQADGGRIAAANNGFGPGESAASVFGDIADAGRSALADIRALLGLLHEDTDDGVGPGDGLSAPQPGIEAIPALLDEVRRTGTHVRLQVTGEPRPLPAGTALTAYRAVQEALTNTVKHAGPGARAVVELAWCPDHLALDVVDDGPVQPVLAGPVAPAAASLGGHGLRGMRERVGAHGGTVEAGPRPGRGFGVHLELPYADPP